MKIIGKTNDLPDNGHQREFYSVEVADGVYSDVMCCFSANPFYYLMEDENGSTLNDGLGGSLGVAENEDEIIEFVRSFVEERQRMAEKVKILYRFELGFGGTPENVGLFQGVDATPIPYLQKEEFYNACQELTLPQGLETPDGSDIVFFFTEKGLEKFAGAINFAIQELNDVYWQVLGMPLVLDGDDACGLTLRDAIYVDEDQVAFSYSDLAEIGHRYDFEEVKLVAPKRRNPLVLVSDDSIEVDKIPERKSLADQIQSASNRATVAQSSDNSLVKMSNTLDRR